MHVSNHEENQHTAVIAAAWPLIFFIFRYYMTSIFIKLYMGGFETQGDFHRVYENPNPSSNEGVMQVSNHEENQHTTVIAAAGPLIFFFFG